MRDALRLGSRASLCLGHLLPAYSTHTRGIQQLVLFWHEICSLCHHVYDRRAVFRTSYISHSNEVRKYLALTTILLLLVNSVTGPPLILCIISYDSLVETELRCSRSITLLYRVSSRIPENHNNILSDDKTNVYKTELAVKQERKVDSKQRTTTFQVNLFEARSSYSLL